MVEKVYPTSTLTKGGFVLIDSITRLQLELTDKCNSRCPMCTRQFMTDLNTREMSFTDFKLFFPQNFLSHLTNLLICGNFGEPTLCTDLFKILEYVHWINPYLVIRLHTNGGTGEPWFWYRLSRFFLRCAEGSEVVFGIDGLEDTNHLYRIGVDWTTLMQNVGSYLNGQGPAVWSFIPFKHNQHQFQTIKHLAKDLGFLRVDIQQTRRFEQWNVDFLDYYIRDGITKHTLEPADSEYFLRKKKTKSTKGCEDKCLLHHKHEVYVDSWGNVHPCCWFASFPRGTFPPERSLYVSSIDSILEQPFFNRDLKDTWDNVLSVCHRKCWVY